jgi:hypothetical protein
METQVILVRYGQDARTGHISVVVKSHTVDGKNSWDGPERTYGTDAASFQKRFNSDPEQFEAWVAGEHKQYMGANDALMEHLASRKGKVIGTL